MELVEALVLLMDELVELNDDEVEDVDVDRLVELVELEVEDILLLVELVEKVLAEVEEVEVVVPVASK